MDARTYGRLVERGGYATGGIVLGFDGSTSGASSMVAYDPASGHVAWLEPEDPPAFVYPALGVTKDHLIGPPYYAAMWAAKRARDESSIDATLRGHIERARSESHADTAVSGFDGWPSVVASWERNARTAGDPPLYATFGLDARSPEWGWLPERVKHHT